MNERNRPKGGSSGRPPAASKKPGGRDAMSVYPPRSVGVVLGGYRSTPMTQAVRCWAHLLGAATLDVGKSVKAEEWNFLALATEGLAHEFDPEWGNPGDQLAQLVERAVNFEVGGLEVLGNKAAERARSLATRLRGMDYLHAWAVIWCLQWREHMAIEAGAGEWWTLGHRQSLTVP